MMEPGELKKLLARLRQTHVVQHGEVMTIDMHDGHGPQQVNSGDIVSIRNPDGPAAADALEAALLRISEQNQLLSEAFDFLGGVDGATEIRGRLLAVLSPLGG